MSVYMAYPVISGDRRIQTHYEFMREQGQSHNMAELLALRQPPGDKGMERTLFEGKLHNHGLDGMPEWMVREILADAKAAGISTTGKIWQSALGPADDPKAWVSDAHDVLAVAEERNLPLAGVLSRRAREAEAPPETVRMADDLVQWKMEQAIESNPDKARNLEELRHEVIEANTPSP